MKTLLPVVKVTILASPSDTYAKEIHINVKGVTESYYVKHIHQNGTRLDEKPAWMHSCFNLFPIVIDEEGVPWAEANIYLLAKAECSYVPKMSTYASIADSLSAFRTFLDEEKVDWLYFPLNKLFRPTYRYHAHLKTLTASQQIKPSTAKRRMSAVNSFYEWLIEEEIFKPENKPWQAQERYLSFTGAHGLSHLKKIAVKDVSIKHTQSRDFFDGSIVDGGRLKPIPDEKLYFLLEALHEIKNIEMTLIHLFALATGARIQTILTFRVNSLYDKETTSVSEYIRVPVGPGTSVDTKYNKPMTLHIPIWLYEKLKIYFESERALKRREKSKNILESPYIFLSERGTPFYRSLEDSMTFNDDHHVRHEKNGQAIRQFITERVLPLIREKYSEDFNYRFHDTRATFGMNLTRQQLDRVANGEITLHQAREYVRSRMGHKSSATTDSYLQYDSNASLRQEINSKYEQHLKILAENIN